MMFQQKVLVFFMAFLSLSLMMNAYSVYQNNQINNKSDKIISAMAKIQLICAKRVIHKTNMIDIACHDLQGVLTNGE